MQKWHPWKEFGLVNWKQYPEKGQKDIHINDWPMKETYTVTDLNVLCVSRVTLYFVFYWRARRQKDLKSNQNKQNKNIILYCVPNICVAERWFASNLPINNFNISIVYVNKNIPDVVNTTHTSPSLLLININYWNRYFYCTVHCYDRLFLDFEPWHFIVGYCVVVKT